MIKFSFNRSFDWFKDHISFVTFIVAMSPEWAMSMLIFIFITPIIQPNGSVIVANTPKETNKIVSAANWKAHSGWQFTTKKSNRYSIHQTSWETSSS